MRWIRRPQGDAHPLYGAASLMAPIFAKGGADAALQLKFAMDAAAEETGKSMAGKLTDALFGPEVWVDADRKAQGHFARQGGQGFEKIGEVIGEAIGKGIGTTIGAGATNWVHALGARADYFASALPPDPLSQVNAAILHAEARWLMSFDQGGTVPGYRGQPQFAIVHGGERVQTPAQQAAGNADVVAAIREQTQVLRAMGSGSSTGGLAALNALLEQALRARDRGLQGLY